jgi:hypothetical protein
MLFSGQGPLLVPAFFIVPAAWIDVILAGTLVLCFSIGLWAILSMGILCKLHLKPPCGSLLITVARLNIPFVSRRIIELPDYYSGQFYKSSSRPA